MSKRRILIVDDMIVNRKLMKKVLQPIHNEIEFYDAEDGIKAMDILNKKEIDLVILDLMMPGKDGYQVLKEIKMDDDLKSIPVIVNSALDNMNSIEKTLKLGAIDYFTKPITVEEMKVIIPLKVKNALTYYYQRRQLLKYNKKIKEELDLANILQKSLINPKGDNDLIKIISKYIPSSQIGGDYLECIKDQDKLWFIVADVAGHGVAAAMVSSMIKAMFTHCIKDSNSPKAILEEINETFINISDNKHLCFTAFIGLLEGDVLKYSNAGHPYPIIISQNLSNCSMLEESQFPIGMFSKVDYKENYINFKKNDIIVAYTDGIYEVENSNKDYTHEDVFNFIENNKQYLSIDNKMRVSKKNKDIDNVLIDYFMEKMLMFFGGKDKKGFKDDIGIMTLKKLK